MITVMHTYFLQELYQYKYQSKATMQTQNQYLDYLIDTSFQEVNILFVL